MKLSALRKGITSLSAGIILLLLLCCRVSAADTQ